MTNIYKSEEGKQKIEALYRQALQRWPVPNRQLLVPTGQGDTFAKPTTKARRHEENLLY